MYSVWQFSFVSRSIEQISSVFTEVANTREIVGSWFVNLKPHFPAQQSAKIFSSVKQVCDFQLQDTSFFTGAKWVLFVWSCIPCCALVCARVIKCFVKCRACHEPFCDSSCFRGQTAASRNGNPGSAEELFGVQVGPAEEGPQNAAVPPFLLQGLPSGFDSRVQLYSHWVWSSLWR